MSIAHTTLRAALACLATLAIMVPWTSAQQLPNQKFLVNVTAATQRLEMVANTSRILTLGERIPRAQVNNPDILSLTPLSETQVQLHGLKAGVTQVNLWTENNEVHTIDVLVHGDAQQLTHLLNSQFKTASLKVVPLPNSVIISGYVDRPDEVSRIVAIAQDFYPKVINNITVGGVQQVLLHVKVMEVSRTKLRTLGFDFAATNGQDFVVSSISGLISAAAASSGTAVGGGDTVRFGIVDGSNNFFGFLEALRQNNMMKILAEPTLVTISGRPAFFNVGGEFPVLVPQSLGTVSIEYKKFGTQVDFVPIVLGNGLIRLEVRPRVSEIDSTRSVTINNTTIPGLRVREVDTGVEMRAGQTLALAGLVQTRVEAENKGIPFVSELPWIGGMFRRVHEENNEIELLILVTPEIIEAVEPHQISPIGPGQNTCSPSDKDFYAHGHLEVPCCDGENCGAQGFNLNLNETGTLPPVTEEIIESNAPITEEVAPGHEVRVPFRGSPRQAVGRPLIGIVQQAVPSQAPRQPTNLQRATPVISTPAPGLIGGVGYDVEE